MDLNTAGALKGIVVPDSVSVTRSKNIFMMFRCGWMSLRES